ncbi:MAG: hypothetical protein R3A47_02990 [Polyangiales bacterium]
MTRYGIRKRIASWLTVFALFMQTSLVHAGDVEGSLTNWSRGNTSSSTFARPGYWHVAIGATSAVESLPPFGDVTIALIAKGNKDAVGCDYMFEGGALNTATLVAQKGKAFEIRNDDLFEHWLFAKDMDELASIQTAPGKSRKALVSRSGSWPLADSAHANVSGYLHVLDEVAACVLPTTRGQFALKALAPGQYEVQVYRDTAMVGRRPFTVSGNSTLTLDPIELKAPAAPKGGR